MSWWQKVQTRWVRSVGSQIFRSLATLAQNPTPSLTLTRLILCTSIGVRLLIILFVLFSNTTLLLAHLFTNGSSSITNTTDLENLSMTFKLNIPMKFLWMEIVFLLLSSLKLPIEWWLLIWIPQELFKLWRFQKVFTIQTTFTWDMRIIFTWLDEQTFQKSELLREFQCMISSVTKMCLFIIKRLTRHITDLNRQMSISLLFKNQSDNLKPKTLKEEDLFMFPTEVENLLQVRFCINFLMLPCKLKDLSQGFRSLLLLKFKHGRFLMRKMGKLELWMNL